MLLGSSEAEVKKRETALKIIKSKIKKEGRSTIYDLSGLAGGFPLKKDDIDLLETYVGPALYKEKLERLGIEHLGGEKILPFNRTTAGILATILALVKPGDEVVHYLPRMPSHPATPRSVRLVGASYKEFDNIEKFRVTNNTSLVMITGSTMDHDIIRQKDFLKVVEISKSKNIPIFVDDASGARLRTVIYNQPKATDMGADMVITSTYKLMNGPRGGIMAGKEDLIYMIKSKAYEFGLEAQPPIIAGMARALEEFNPKNMLEAFHKKNDIYKALKSTLANIKETPTGIMLSANDLMHELNRKGIKTSLSHTDIAFIFSMLLLRNYNIITITAVGMPGCSPTIRIDLASKDAERVDNDYIVSAMSEAFLKLSEVVNDKKTCENLLFGT
ncbi:MAG: TIGR03576 family pyridoxal phosphate-dependent enzyme [Euryarchaeota archaeon]|nr:TIGR03576 family pyridoxal phosphate-dependent enzyme [Euryarchaeota archaeon]